MPPAQVSDFPDIEEERPVEGVRNNSLQANWRILAVSLYMGISLFEYGFDKGATAGFQAMPGFLMVFGYEKDGEYGIKVGSLHAFFSFSFFIPLTDVLRPAHNKSSAPL